jgi:PDZ domain-containing protein
LHVSRRTAKLLTAAVLVVLLSMAAALLPVPYVVLKPGPTADTLGRSGKTVLIRIEGRRTYPTDGHLDLTTVSVLGGPSRRMNLGTALRGWIDDQQAVVPEEQVFPPGETAEEVQKEGQVDMRASQANATTAALRQLGIPVTTRLVVQRLVDPSPAKGRLLPGDEVLAVDDQPVQGSVVRLRQLVTRQPVGQRLRITLNRDGRQLTQSVTTRAADDGRPVIGVLTRVDADYPFTVEISLKDVGGPSAGLMFALGIVDKLTPGALTGGAHVAGTGTIDDRGRVGPIGGIPQKMAGARAAGATVFLVPPGNCAEAVANAPDGLRLVKADTLAHTVSALDALRAGRGRVPRCTG